MTVRTLQWMARVGSGQQGQAAPVGGGRPSGGTVHVRAAEAAEDGDGFGAAVRGHVRERLLDRRAGVGAGWSGRGAREVTGAGRVIGRFAVIGAIASDRVAVVLVKNGRRTRKATPRPTSSGASPGGTRTVGVQAARPSGIAGFPGDS
jgi:hypothetical protein